MKGSLRASSSAEQDTGLFGEPPVAHVLMEGKRIDEMARVDMASGRTKMNFRPLMNAEIECSNH